MRARLPVRIDEIRQLQNDFTLAHVALLTAHRQAQIAQNNVQDRLASFEAERRNFDALLRTITARAEAAMAQSRDQAGVQISAGIATVKGINELFSSTMNESYPLVQDLYKLTRDSVTLQEVATSFVNVKQTDALPAVARRADLTFANAREVIDRVGSQVQSRESQDYMRRFASGMEELEKKLTGGQGLFPIHRDGLKIESEIATMQQALVATESRYVGSLEEVRQLVEKHNEGAKTRAGEVVNQALAFIGLLVLAGVWAGIIFSLFFANRIVGPITRITGAMTELAGGNLDVGPGAEPDGRNRRHGRRATGLQG